MNQAFSTVRHGYSPEEVDSYITELQELIDLRNRELMEIKNAHVENVSATSEAESQGQAILAQAKSEAAEILSKAQQDAEFIIMDAQSHASTIRQRADSDLDDMKAQVIALAKKVDEFSAAYQRILQQYLVSARAGELTALLSDLNRYMNKLGVPREEEAVSVNDIAVRKTR